MHLGYGFWRLLTASTISTIGDYVYSLALPVTLLALGYEPWLTTVVYGATMGATVVVGLFLGGLADAYFFGRLLPLVFVASAAALCLFAVLIGAGHGDPGLLAVLGALALGGGAALSAASVDAAVPRILVEPAKVRTGYSLIESTRVVGSVIGLAAAGAVAALRSAAAVMVVNAVSFLVAAPVSWLRRPPSGETADHGDGARQVSSGLRRLAEAGPGLRRGVALSFGVNLLTGAEPPLLVTRLVRELSISAGTTSMLIAGSTIGSVALAALVARGLRTVTAWTVMTGSAVAIGLAAVGVGLGWNGLLVTAAYCVLGAGMISYNVQWRTYRREVSDEAVLGEISAACRSIAYLGVAVGVGLVSLLQGHGATAAVLFTASGVSCALGTAGLALWSVRRQPRPVAALESR